MTGVVNIFFRPNRKKISLRDASLMLHIVIALLNDNVIRETLTKRVFMGDRSLVVLTDGNEVSPVIYSHWGGSQTPYHLALLAKRMETRKGDVSYAAARLVQIQTEGDDGNLSHGISNADHEIQAAARAVMNTPGLGTADAVLAGMSHGDAGLFVVNVMDFSWQCFDGIWKNSKEWQEAEDKRRDVLEKASA